MKKEKVIFREYRKEDREELENIIRETWNYDQFCSSKVARKMARTYLANCLANQTFTQVAVINNRPVGIILGKKILHFKCPLKFRVKQILSILSIYLSKEGRKIIKIFGHIDRIDEELLYHTNKNYEGEIALFVVNSKCRGLGIGKSLFFSLKSYMEREKIKNFFLYIDTSCNYGFYEHYNMIKKGEMSYQFQVQNQMVEMIFFIYEYSFVNICK